MSLHFAVKSYRFVYKIMTFIDFVQMLNIRLLYVVIEEVCYITM